MAEQSRKGYGVMVRTALLTAIVVIMAFTPLGYLKTAGLEISFLMIPVIVGAVVVSPGVGAFLGGVFGITSFIQCFGLSAFGAALLSINPVFTFITCLVPRVLAGWFTGLVYKALSGLFKKKNIVPIAAASLGGAVFNTVLFMSALMLFFAKSELIVQLGETLGTDTVIGFVAAFVGVNGVVEAAVAIVAGTAICKVLLTIYSRSENTSSNDAGDGDGNRG